MPSACCCTVSPITWSSYFASNCHRRCAPRKSKLCALSCSRSVRESVKPLVVSAFTWPAAGLSKISSKPPRFATPPNYPNCSTTHSRKGQAELSLKTIREIKKRLANRYEHRQPGRKPVPRQQWALCITISGPDELTRLATSATARNRRFLLKMFAIESLFEVVVDAAQFKVPKPSPEVFEITLKKLSLEPTTCWIIEDSINGLIAARQAGCFAVGITTSFSSQTLRDAGADLVVESFAQLHSHLAGAPPRFPNSR